MPKQQTTEEKIKVIIEEGTPLAEFQKVRTDAISEMFDTKNELGIYQTSRFFAKLDDCVRSLLSQTATQTREEMKSQYKSEIQRYIDAYHYDSYRLLIYREILELLSNLKEKQK